MPPTIGRMAGIPEKPSLDGLEARWSAVWEDSGTYRFDRSHERGEIFSIDTPPPTVSGSLHMGSAFGYVQTDAIARYQRMRGRHVFYPMGWDDNGLPTERRVQNYFGVRCEPHLPYDPAFVPPEKPGKDVVPISRPNFLELCEQLVAEDEAAFEDLWRRLGLSVDWNLTYTTVGPAARRTSQRAFLRNLARGEAYQAEAPTLWDVDFRTAVAQAELEDREMPGAYHALRFHKADGSGDVLIDTTRPELLAACVAVVAHPDDARFQPLFGAEVITPLYGARVPIVAHHLADPEKGTGIAMICTFGDTTDVVWWRELQLRDARDPRNRRPVQAEPPDGHRAGGRRRVRGDRGPQREAGAEDRRRAVAGVGRARRRAAPDHAPGEVLREGRTPARDRHLAAVVPPQRRSRSRPARRAPRARARAALASRRRCASATTRGSTG